MRNDNRERWGCSPGPRGPRPPWFDREARREWHRGRRGRPHSLFLRFAFVFGLLALLIIGAASVAAYLAATLAHGIGLAMPEWLAGTYPHAPLLWARGLLVILILLFVTSRVARRASRGITRPLEGVMQAAEAVAAGDLSARAPAYGPGEFARLAESFNHMVAELERADTQRRNLTADVAHELRTPLHIIQGNLEGILDDVYEPSPEHIRATLDEARDLARLVEDLRTLSLAEAGQLALAHEPVDVAELLHDAATSFSGQAEAAGIGLDVEVRGDPAGLRVTGDAGRLDQVLGNLLANALRHTGAGGRITMSAEAIASSQSSVISSQGGRARAVRIWVADTGEGIPAGALPYVFDRFWRGDRNRSRAGGAGSGLGLAIARQLVQAHGGRIEVRSEVGRGTTFTIDLPQNADEG